MKQFLKSHLQDCSSSEKFCYALTCAECKTVWKSTPVRFSMAGQELLTEAKHIIAQTLYKREQAQAIEHAAHEAVHHFNACPLCGRLVCNYCFVICDDLDMCRACATRLQEAGESVLERMSESACNA